MKLVVSSRTYAQFFSFLKRKLQPISNFDIKESVRTRQKLFIFFYCLDLLISMDCYNLYLTDRHEKRQACNNYLLKDKKSWRAFLTN